MLDRKFILENSALVKENCARRGVREQVDELVELEHQRRAALQRMEQLNREANEVSRTIGQAKDAAEREARKEQGRLLREQKDQAQREHDDLEQQVLALQMAIPNLTHPEAPVGRDDASNVEVGRGRTPVRTFDFRPLDHVQIGEKWDWIDFAGGARTTGAGFYFLKGELVLLDLALQQFAVEELVRRGYLPTMTPDLAQDSILQGIGFMPRGPETQVYSIDGTSLSLVGTAEITLGGLYADQILEESQLPLRLCGISHCYRTEAGAAGRASRGLYRVHQFTKVEMFAFTRPEDSEAMHQRLLAIEERIFRGLEIPYRVLDIAGADLGGPAYRKYDVEAWMPGRGEQGEYGEVTSTSNCTDYQARRLQIRFKTPGQKGTQFVHMLNGTAVACGRAIIALLENHQQPDGRIRIPPALVPYFGKNSIG